ncbi:MAG TPA: tetratricopeptide repeat protein [Deltaproteobacteria bacterium]|nr:tetratricopeptide repeat protein [Deltaproteobacteria bacterium]HPP80558.1 tetratricopeptide repeat protein [Deltaproteobacteria bacterium]
MDHSRYLSKIKGYFFEESTITLGTGHTQRTQRVKNYCIAEQVDDEKVRLTFLGNEGKPTGIVIELPIDEFLRRYTLDPEYRVKTKEEAEHDRHIALAEKHRARGEHYSAEFEYTKALKIDPDSIRANFGIGTLYMEMGDTEKAKDVFRKLSEIEAIFDEENKHIFNEFGIELRKANMVEEALANYKKAITISPDDEHLYFNVARLHYDKREWETALAWLQKALDLNPEFADAKRFKSLILKEMEAGADPGTGREGAGEAKEDDGEPNVPSTPGQPGRKAPTPQGKA